MVSDTGDTNESNEDDEVTSDDDESQSTHVQLSENIETKRIVCTVCNGQIIQQNLRSLAPHPLLGVIICKSCLRQYHSGGSPTSWDKDDEGFDEYCRWCGNGGQVYSCDTEGCKRSFCRVCLKRNLDRVTFANICENPDTNWECVVCDNTPIQQHVKQCQSLMEFLQQKELKELEKNKRRSTFKSDLTSSATTSSLTNLESKELHILSFNKLEKRLRDLLELNADCGKLYRSFLKDLHVANESVEDDESADGKSQMEDRLDIQKNIARVINTMGNRHSIVLNSLLKLKSDAGGVGQQPSTSGAAAVKGEMAAKPAEPSSSRPSTSAKKATKDGSKKTEKRSEQSTMTYKSRSARSSDQSTEAAGGKTRTTRGRPRKPASDSADLENTKAAVEPMVEEEFEIEIAGIDEGVVIEDDSIDKNKSPDDNHCTDKEDSSGTEPAKEKTATENVVNGIAVSDNAGETSDTSTNENAPEEEDEGNFENLLEKANAKSKLEKKDARGSCPAPKELTDAQKEDERLSRFENEIMADLMDVETGGSSRTVSPKKSNNGSKKNKEGKSESESEANAMDFDDIEKSVLGKDKERANGVQPTADVSDDALSSASGSESAKKAENPKKTEESNSKKVEKTPERATKSDSEDDLFTPHKSQDAIEQLLKSRVSLANEKKSNGEKSALSRKRAGKKGTKRQLVSSGDDENGSKPEQDVSEYSDSDDSVVQGSSSKSSDQVSGSDASASDSGAGKSKRKRGRPKKGEKSKGKSKKPRKRIRLMSESDGEDSENGDTNAEKSGAEQDADTPSKRKNRKIIKHKNLAQETKDAFKAEKDRQSRISALQKEYNFIEYLDDSTTGSRMADAKVLKVVLEIDQDKEPLLEVEPELVKSLKPHQAEGIQFMYNNLIESIEKTENGSTGGGCILAHCMGLGKTLQVITFLHTVMSCARLKMKTCLVVAPLNTVLNWVAEFEKWLTKVNPEFEMDVYELSQKRDNYLRATECKRWMEHGGVMIIGYDLFRMLSAGTRVKQKKYKDTLLRCLLDPGPDIVVCDEGHMLKNHKSALSIQMCKLRTLRRICLTGTPLQNNLMEYHTMLQFVRPNLLGTHKEFANRFANPIKIGQHIDSTEYEVRRMKRRAHVLHKTLEGCVHRRDYNALTKFLPPKHEYVLSVRLTDRQIQLYQTYLNVEVGSTDRESLKMRRSLFKDYMMLHRCWTHPYALRLYQIIADKKAEKEQYKFELDEFIDDERDTTSSDDSETKRTKKAKKKAAAAANRNTFSALANIAESAEESDYVPKGDQDGGLAAKKYRTRAKADDIPEETFDLDAPLLEDRLETHWWLDLVEKGDEDKPELSGKLMLLFEIIKKCQEIGDKLLVFSQSLGSLTLIERMLHAAEEKDLTTTQSSVELVTGQKWGWQHGVDYFRFDGSTPAQTRQAYAEEYNRRDNYQARLFLISTKAGGLGINLAGANRVVIFDASWNPAQDVQSIFRAYRFGQTKPVYVYRFLAQGTMEEKIYDRQITKESLSCRVVDEQQIDRYFTADDLQALYEFTPDDPGAKNKRPTPAMPKDRMMAELLLEQKDLIFTYHEHDSLLQNIEEEHLDEDERMQAWEDFEAEKEGRRMPDAMPGGMPYVPPGSSVADMLSNGISQLIAEGNRLIHMSGQPVSRNMESIIRDLCTQNPAFLRQPVLLYQKLSQIVGGLKNKITELQTASVDLQDAKLLKAARAVYPNMDPQTVVAEAVANGTLNFLLDYSKTV